MIVLRIFCTFLYLSKVFRVFNLANSSFSSTTASLYNSLWIINNIMQHSCDVMNPYIIIYLYVCFVKRLCLRSKPACEWFNHVYKWLINVYKELIICLSVITYQEIWLQPCSNMVSIIHTLLFIHTFIHMDASHEQL